MATIVKSLRVQESLRKGILHLSWLWIPRKENLTIVLYCCVFLIKWNKKERLGYEERELANKYNGAVNEIKDLSDKLKVCISQTGNIEINHP